MVLMFSRLTSVENSTGFKQWLNVITGVAFIGFASKLALMQNS